MRTIKALMIVAALALIAASCGKDGQPLGSPPLPTPPTTETIAPPDSAAPTTTAPTTEATTTAPAETSTSTTTSLPSDNAVPEPDATAVAAALASGWSAVTLRAGDTGMPKKIADNAGLQVITGSSFSGCCFEYGDLFVLQADETWADITDPALQPLDPLPPGGQPFIGDGPFDLQVIDGLFVAPGATVFDPGTGDQPIPSPRIWSSPDGTSWSSQEIAAQGTVTSVINTSNGDIAIIDDGVDTNTLWRSPDGQTWSVDPSVDITAAENLAPGDFSFGSSDRIDRVGEELVISSDIGPALLVSDDDGLTWHSPDPTMASGNFVATNGGAILLTPDQILHTWNGTDWTPLGGVPAPLMTDSGISIDTFGLVAVDIGNSTVIWPGGDPFSPNAGRFWVADGSTDWIEVGIDPVFAPVADGPVTITDMILGVDGRVEAIGTVPRPFQGNKPLNDYMIWTHPTLTSDQ